MKFLIAFLLFLTLNAYANDDLIIDDFIDVMFTSTNSKEMTDTEKLQVKCMLNKMFANISDKEKGYIQLVIDHKKAFPQKSFNNAENSISEIYDPSGEISKSIDEKANTLNNQFDQCLAIE